MHICEVPVNNPRRHWWTCENCGQTWHRFEGQWRMTHPEAMADGVQS